MLYWAVFIVVAVLICKYFVNLQRQWTLTDKVSRWTFIPFLGNICKFLGNSEVIYSRIVEISKLAEEKNGRFRIWLGPLFAIMTINPDDMKLITNSLLEKPYYYHFGRVWLGHGLVTAPVDVWKKNIKNLAGTFTGNIVEGFQDVFNERSEILMMKLKSEVGKPPFDAMKEYLAYATLETICQTSLGVTNISDVITDEYYEAFNATLELLINRGFNILMHPEFIYKMTPSYRKLKKYVNTLHGVSNLVIAEKRKKWEEQKRNGVEESDENRKGKFKTFLDILLAFSERDPDLTDDQIRAEVDTIIVGGQETNASTLLFVLLLLGSHPRAQDKLYKEIKEVFGDSKRAVEKDDLPKLQYCEAVINETLRLYPPIPIIMRYADKDLELSDGVTIPKGASAVLGIWGAGHSQKLWGKDAEKFLPERWIENAIPANAIFSFSCGRRSCIGRRYAMSLLKTILVWCVRELEFVSELHKLKLKCDIALRPFEGHLLQVHLRNNIGSQLASAVTT